MDQELRAHLARNAELKNLHQGKRCFIIGNGPSIKDQDLELLSGEITFAVNRFIHHPRAEAINPKYYAIVDPKFAAQAWGTEFVREVERRLPETVLLLTRGGYEFCEREGVLTKHRKYVIHPNQLFHFGYRRAIDLTRGIPGMDNVTKCALSTAAYMGCAEINLLGIDGNGLILPDNSHFYGHEPPPSDQVALEKALVSMSMGLRSWRAAASYLEERGVKLISRNPRSVMTALPRGPYPP